MTSAPAAAFAGFLLGFSLILAIGAQNAFVLRQGIRRAHVLPVVLTCALSDAVVIALGVAGFGQLTQVVPWLPEVMRWGGALFLMAYGAMAFRSAWRGGAALRAADQGTGSLRAAVLTCLGLTWLNPHVYLDTVVLLGSVASTYDGARLAFGAGAVTASFVFFFSLGLLAQILAPWPPRPNIWRFIEAAIGCLMWLIAIKLALFAVNS